MGSPSGEVLGGRVPESALALEGSPYRVPFRERTRGESVRGGRKGNSVQKAPYPFEPKLDSKVDPKNSPKNKPPPEAPFRRLLAPSADMLAPNM